jgi:hypothetical protein
MSANSNKNQAARDGFEQVQFQPRMNAAIAVEVSGFDKNLRFFTEHTAASHFSDNSCCFRLRALIPPDGLLALQCVGGDVASPTRPVFYQAVWLKQIATGILVRAVPIGTEKASPNGLSASSVTPFGKT